MNNIKINIKLKIYFYKNYISEKIMKRMQFVMLI